MSRIISWFSHGAASAVASKLAIEQLSKDNEVLIVNCDTRPSEHPDNYRFSEDCERWFGQKIVFIRNDKYNTVDDVFERERYMSGQYGARCTTEVKKVPRFAFQHPDDIHIWGFTAGERKRMRDFEKNNPELNLNWILAKNKITHQRCLEILDEAGIKRPAMYEMFDAEDRARFKVNGFDNNNCPGCVKSSSPWYWDMIRKYFPDVFKRRCEQSRSIGCRLVELGHHKRIFLDELPAGPFKKYKKKERISCGPDCGLKPI